MIRRAAVFCFLVFATQGCRHDYDCWGAHAAEQHVGDGFTVVPRHQPERRDAGRDADADMLDADMRGATADAGIADANADAADTVDVDADGEEIADAAADAVDASPAREPHPAVKPSVEYRAAEHRVVVEVDGYYLTFTLPDAPGEYPLSSLEPKFTFEDVERTAGTLMLARVSHECPSDCEPDDRSPSSDPCHDCHDFAGTLSLPRQSPRDNFWGTATFEFHKGAVETTCSTGGFGSLHYGL